VQGIVFHEELNAIGIIKKQNISILIDESTDVSISQTLALVAWFFDVKNCKTVERLLQAFEGRDGTSEGITLIGGRGAGGLEGWRAGGLERRVSK